MSIRKRLNIWLCILLAVSAGIVLLYFTGAGTREKRRQIEALVGHPRKDVVSLRGEPGPGRRYTDPKDFQATWNALANEEVVSPRSYPPASGEVWLYPKWRDRKYLHCYRFWMIYFDKQGNVTRVMHTGGWW